MMTPRFDLSHIDGVLRLIAIGEMLMVALVVLHDAWFCWMHRAMHTRALFRLTPLAHHRSRPAPQ